MLPYVPFYYQSGWKGAIRSEMLDGNVFCYGKSGSGKSAKVGSPFLNHALQLGESAIIYAKNPEDVASYTFDIQDYEGYNLTLLHTNNQLTEQMWREAEADLDKPFIYLIADATPDCSPQYNAVDQIISFISKKIIENNIDTRVAVLLDGLCGNMLVQSEWLKNPKMHTCLITTDQVANAHWRMKNCYALCDYHYDQKTEARITVNTFMFESKKTSTDYMIMQFVNNFDTIFCCGVNSVKPDDHKYFIRMILLGGIKVPGLNGRFCVTTVRPKNALIDKSRYLKKTGNDKEIDIQDMDIETTDYRTIAERDIVPGKWIVEVDGRVVTFTQGENFAPITFFDKSVANTWMEKIFSAAGITSREAQSGEDVTIYNIPAKAVLPQETVEDTFFTAANYLHVIDYARRGVNYYSSIRDGSIQTEITMTRITYSNCETYRMNFLLSILELLDVKSEANDLKMVYQMEDPTEEQLTDEMFFYMVKNWEEEINKKIDEAMAKEQAAEMEDAPRYTPYIKKATEEDIAEQDRLEPLPQSGVLFLGGHQNMTKKLKQIFPDWTYISDDLFRDANLANVHTIFYWTNHSSHSMQEFVNARKGSDVSYIYVTATNINRLINEMEEKYRDNISKREA